MEQTLDRYCLNQLPSAVSMFTAIHWLILSHELYITSHGIKQSIWLYVDSITTI